MFCKSPLCLGVIGVGLALSGQDLAAAGRLADATPAASPPPIEREFRGVWVATVDNIDWPSRKDLSTAEQKAELVALLDRATKLKLNAIVLQVRPQCDAIYPSALEPWSEFLTGQMGKAPQPAWDPLEFAVAEAHRRGLELHAWFNPYRALHPAAKGPVSSGHISRTRPDLVRKYGSYLWLDPGEREVQDHSIAVVLDVVRRYDVDGVHFDDYFYPYPEKDPRGQEVDFPDRASWEKFGKATNLSRADWRRENANEFVRRLYESVKAEKPWVKVGISPFGIWRPGYPAQIKGFDQHEKLYADARKWLVNGWLDYFTPQLYWPIDPPAQSFPVLLDWWNDHNPKQRHIWPGLAISKLSEGWKPEEIVRQVRLAEKQPVSSGVIFFSMKHFQRHPRLTAALEAESFKGPALVPATPWLDAARPQSPSVTVAHNNSTRITWSPATGAPIQQWAVQYRVNQQWRTEIFPASVRTISLRSDDVQWVAVTAVSRSGQASAPTVKSAAR
jgi:uncharacterized lipoprotein YddW (UPF0748 family)